MYGISIFFACVLLLIAIWFGVAGANRPALFPAYSNATTTPRTDADRIINDVLESGDASAYRGQIAFDTNQNGPRDDSVRTEYLILRTARTTESPISLSGWRLENSRGQSVAIPVGVETLRVGSVNETNDVIVSSGEEIIIATGPSPVGYSFKENVCTGYLEEHQDFTPSLDAQCPHPADELSRAGSLEGEACRDYIRGIGACEAPTDVPSDLPSSCAQFVEKYLSHTSCVRAHEQDTDFTGPTWRIFLGQMGELYDNERETIRLIDREGKVVDVMAY